MGEPLVRWHFCTGARGAFIRRIVATAIDFRLGDGLCLSSFVFRLDLPQRLHPLCLDLPLLSSFVFRLADLSILHPSWLAPAEWTMFLSINNATFFATLVPTILRTAAPIVTTSPADSSPRHPAPSAATAEVTETIDNLIFVGESPGALQRCGLDNKGLGLTGLKHLQFSYPCHCTMFYAVNVFHCSAAGRE